MAGIRGMRWGLRDRDLHERVDKLEITVKVAQRCTIEWTAENDCRIDLLERRVMRLEAQLRDLEQAFIDAQEGK